MKIFLFIVLISATLLSTTQGASLKSTKMEGGFADIGPDCWVKWIVNSEAKTVNFSVTARSPGWLGFGCSDQGTMAGADLIWGWVDDKDGSCYLKDGWSDGPGGVYEDASQDWILAGCTQTSSDTTLNFWRKWNTNDAVRDKELKPGETTNYICAWGATDTIDYHGPQNRASVPVVVIPVSE